MMQDITILPANLVTLVLESFLYGFLVLLFISTVYFLATRRTLAGQSAKHHLTSLVFLTIAALFTLITVVSFMGPPILLLKTARGGTGVLSYTKRSSHLSISAMLRARIPSTLILPNQVSLPSSVYFSWLSSSVILWLYVRSINLYNSLNSLL
jgi:hypothetical protein